MNLSKFSKITAGQIPAVSFTQSLCSIHGESILKKVPAGVNTPTVLHQKSKLYDS